MNPIKIIVLQRGWVVIGRYFRNGTRCGIDRGFAIRRWGTDAGLGQLALEGEQPDTRLDPTPLASWHELTEIMVLDVDQTKWTDRIDAAPRLPGQS